MSAEDALKRRFRVFDAPKPALTPDVFQSAYLARTLALKRAQITAVQGKHADSELEVLGSGDSEAGASKLLCGPKPRHHQRGSGTRAGDHTQPDAVRLVNTAKAE